jgi:Cu/Ag efflux pump CusA
MAWLVQRSVKARGLVVVLVIMMMGVGAVHLRVMPRDVLPEFQPPTVEVQTEALGLSAAEVEQLITVPLEQDLLNGVAYLDVIRSRSVTGLSSIELVFKAGTNLSRARLLVNERLTQARALPNVSKPPQMLQPLSSASRVMMIGLSSKHLSLIDLSVLARWTIRPRLMGVPGVASVAVWGQRDRQLQVLVEPEQLRSKGVTLDQVIRTTGNAMFVSPLSFLEASTPGTGGFIDGPNQRLGVQHNLPIKTPQDLAKVVVEGTGVAPAAAPDAGPAQPQARPALRLGDVTQVVEDHQPLIGDASSSDGESLMLVVEKFPQANAVEVSGHIDEALQALAPGLAGVKMDSSIYRPATYVEKSTRNLAVVLILGLLLMVLVVGTFLFDWRAAVVSLISVGVSLVAALLVLQLGGATANAMLLAGLVVGLMVVVDSVIVDIEHIFGRLRQRRVGDNGQSVTGVVVDASLRMWRPLMFASLVIVVALAPVFTLKGAPGAFFPAVAIAYAAAVVVSVVVALTLTPVACLLLGPRRLAERDEAPAVRLVHRGHDRLFARATGRVVLAGVGVIVLLGVATLPFLTRGSSMIPTFKDTGLLVHVDGPPGTSLLEMNRITARLSAELRSLRGVRNVGGHIGRAVMSDQVVTASSSELWVTIDPGGYDSTVASIRSVAKGYPGLSSSVSSYPSDRVNQVLPKQKDITVRIFGQDPAILQTKANEVTQAVSQIKGIANAKVDVQPVEPSIEVEVDLAAAQRYGVKPGDVRRAAAVVLSGIEVGSLFEQQKVFDVVVWGTPRARASLSNVQNVLIDTPSGDRVRVGDVATVRVAPSPTAIRHQSVSRYIDVVADVHGRNTGAVDERRT